MRVKYFSFLLFISIIFISCDENFSPKAPYSERYSFNCIVRGDTSSHVATAYKSYDVPQIDSYENKKDSFIDGAFIRMWRGNHEVYVFRDSAMQRRDTSKLNTDIKYYYINNFVPTEGDFLEIEALLPNGRRLYSSTKIPRRVRRNDDDSDLLVTRKLKDYLRTKWIIKNRDHVYLPKLFIDYLESVNGVNVRKKKIIPWRKLQIGDKIKLIYPTPSTDFLIDFEMDIIREAMEDISKNDSVKSKYTVISLVLELSIFDENLSSYYFTVGFSDDSFAIGLDEGDYSNIKNGFGVFGSFYSQKFIIKVSKGFVNSFGYVLYISK